MQIVVRLDNETVGAPVTVKRDGKTSITVPASVSNGTHGVEFRILDKSGAVKHRFVGQPVTIAPATGFAAENPLTMSQSSYLNTKGAKAVPYVLIKTTAAVPSGVSITVGGRPVSGFGGALAKGENKVQLSVPEMKMTNNAVGVAAGTYAVVVTLPGGEKRETSLVITKGSYKPAPAKGGVPTLSGKKK
jgi:hypothetical protein